MSFNKTFCSSPWIHTRITNDGSFVPCRWQKTKVDNTRANISTVSPTEHFQTNMESLRRDLLDGKHISECQPCYDMEKYNKVSGRQRQLLKTGIELDNFEKGVQSSPYYNEFVSTANGVKTSLLPVDWQVDLGNYCNGSCVFCSPYSSSSLATEFFKIGLIDSRPNRPWSRDPKLIKKFIDSIANTKNLKYIHFIGGETLIDPAFKTILKEMIRLNLHTVSIGFTTNLLVWDDDMNDLLSQFSEINLGLSIETLHPVNDYARYPCKHKETREVLDKWIALANKNNWLTQLRMTPTWMTVESLHTIFEYALANNISVESCNFLHRPAFMRMNVLPKDLRQKAIDNLERWTQQHNTTSSSAEINTRNPHTVKQSIVADACSYLTYLKNAAYEPELLPELIEFIKKLETSRGNSILDYMPHYEEFLRSAGY